MPKNKKLGLNSGIQNYQILTNDDEVCTPSLFSILLAKNSKEGTFLENLSPFPSSLSLL